MEFYNNLTEQIKSLNIKSIHLNDKLVDLINIDTIDLTKGKLNIANKYIPILAKETPLEEVVKHLNKPNDFYIVTLNNKLITFDISFHAIKQFFKRFVYIYLHEQKRFDFSDFTNNMFETYTSAVIESLLTDESLLTTDKLEEKNKTDLNLIKDIFSIILKKAKNHKIENHGRHYDIYERDRREKEYKNTTRYFTHPFMFIVEEFQDKKYLKTVELYSSSMCFRSTNKFTADNQRFFPWLRNKLGEI